MKINKGLLSIGLTVVAGIITTIAMYLDIQDTMEDCREMYRDEIRDIVDEELENRVNAS